MTSVPVSHYRTPIILLIIVILVLGVIHWISYKRYLSEWWVGLPQWCFVFLYGVFWGAAIMLTSNDATPFIYFQF